MCIDASVIPGKFICVVLKKESSKLVKHEVGAAFEKFGLDSLDSLLASIKKIAGGGSKLHLECLCERKFKVTVEGSTVSINDIADFLGVNEHVKRAFVEEEKVAGGSAAGSPSENLTDSGIN